MPIPIYFRLKGSGCPAAARLAPHSVSTPPLAYSIRSRICDINEYKNYYEQIDPANAEAIYKRVVEQLENEKKVEDYVSMYSSMKPKQAAAIFDTMTNDLKLVAKILKAMDAEASSSILGAMNAETAAKLTKIMNPSES